MRVLINGAGIRGLATALTLHNKLPFLNIEVLEKVTEPAVMKDEGLTLQPPALKKIHDLGLMESVAANGWATQFRRHYTEKGRMVGESPSGLYGDPMGFPEISIPKLSLHKVLEEAVEKRIGKNTIRRGLNGITYTHDSSGVNLKCSEPKNHNKTEMNCDILISAEETDSPLHNGATLITKGEEQPASRKSRKKIYRGMACADKILDGHSTITAGCTEGMLMCYPLEAPKVVINENGERRQKQMQGFVVEVDERHSHMIKSNNDPQKAIPGTFIGKHIAAELERANGTFELPFLDHRMLFERAYSIEVAAFESRENIKSPSLCDTKHPINALCSDSNGVLTALLDADAIVSSILKHIQMQRDHNSDIRNCGMTTSTRLRNEELVANFSSMEKILLGANGILQDVVASMTGSDVIVKPVLASVRAGTFHDSRNSANDPAFLDRVVDLHLGSGCGARAVTCAVTVIPYNEKMKDLMLSKKISIGKLLKKLRMSGVDPSFKLLSVGKRKLDNMLTRQYELATPDVTFLIYEEMDLNVLLGGNACLRKKIENGKRTRPRARNSFLRWHMKRAYPAEQTAENKTAFVR